MRVFIAYGYRDSDRWIEQLVFPLVEAFGGIVATGERLEGEQISPGVEREILGSDGLLAFATRREPAGDERFTTHRWVYEELAIARQRGRKVLEVRETGVDPQGGYAGDLQRIDFDAAEREQLLIKLAAVLGRWAREADKQIQLLPRGVAEDISSLLSTPGFTAEYTVLERGRPQQPERVEVLPIQGGLFAFARPPEGAYVRLRVAAAGRSWASTYVSLDSFGIELRPENGA
jgi:hypothetical protein